MNKKVLIIAAVVVAFIIFLIWLFTASSKPSPGTKMADLGREHVPVGTKVDYNSNPPTSGPHYEDWIKAGVYDSVKEDGYLIHSLEHGYVVMHYRCSEKSESQQVSSTGSAELSEECKTRQSQLAKVFDKKGKRKLVVVPRPNLDTSFALSSWNWLDKFDQFDVSRVEQFIDTHRDQGPEKTME